MEIEMPKYVDSMLQVLWWEADEFVIAATILGVGIMFHKFLYPILAIYPIMKIMTKLKRQSLDGAALHALYATGLIPLNDEFDDALEKEMFL